LRILNLILSLYVLFLVMTPCCIEIDCEYGLSDEKTEQHLPEHTDDTCDECPPFSFCENCSGFITMQNDPYNVIINLETLVPIIQSTFSKLLVPRIWRPPVLS